MTAGLPANNFLRIRGRLRKAEAEIEVQARALHSGEGLEPALLAVRVCNRILFEHRIATASGIGVLSLLERADAILLHFAGRNSEAARLHLHMAMNELAPLVGELCERKRAGPDPSHR